jgi:hypothetical protein
MNYDIPSVNDRCGYIMSSSFKKPPAHGVSFIYQIGKPCVYRYQNPKVGMCQCQASDSVLATKICVPCEFNRVTKLLEWCSRPVVSDSTPTITVTTHDGLLSGQRSWPSALDEILTG